MVYDAKYQFKTADDLYNDMRKASGALGMNVEEPEWFELPMENDIITFKRSLESYKRKNGDPIIVVIVLKNGGNYSLFKNACYSMNVVSQVV
jgi:hypothetical protein